MEAHLTTASFEETKGGFEIYQFSISRHIVPAMASRMARLNGDPEVIKETMVQFYCHADRPTAREVLEVKISPSNQRSSMVDVTLIIKRGHWEVASWLKNAQGAMVTATDSELRFYSMGELIKTLPLSCLP